MPEGSHTSQAEARLQSALIKVTIMEHLNTVALMHQKQMNKYESHDDVICQGGQTAILCSEIASFAHNNLTSSAGIV